MLHYMSWKFQLNRIIEYVEKGYFIMLRKTIATISLILCLFASQAAAVERYVPNQYPNIKAAIEACSDGDEVIVADGIYSGNYNRAWEIVGLNITVRSENGPQFTIIDCQGPYSSEYRNSILLDSGCVDGFTITNARGTTETLVVPLSLIGDCVVKNCIIANNVGPFGAGICCIESSPTISNCIIKNNTAQASYEGVEQIVPSAGGGIFCCVGSPVIVNCVISGNSAQHGGGICFGASSFPKVINCTITGNFANFGGGIYSSLNSNPVLINSIIRDNLASFGSQIHVTYDSDTQTHSAVTISHSNIQGGQEDIYTSLYSTITWGFGNIDADPLFVDATNGVYYISVASPCRDVGNNTPVGYFETDLAGNTRIVGNAVDIGAYECQILPAEPEPATSTGSIVITYSKISVNSKSGLGFTVKGTFDSEYFESQNILVRVGPYEEILYVENDFLRNSKGNKYFYKNAKGQITVAKFNLTKETFLIVGKKIAVSPLAGPVEIEISLDHE